MRYCACPVSKSSAQRAEAQLRPTSSWMRNAASIAGATDLAAQSSAEAKVLCIDLERQTVRVADSMTTEKLSKTMRRSTFPARYDSPGELHILQPHRSLSYIPLTPRSLVGSEPIPLVASARVHRPRYARRQHVGKFPAL